MVNRHDYYCSIDVCAACADLITGKGTRATRKVLPDTRYPRKFLPDTTLAMHANDGGSSN